MERTVPVREAALMYTVTLLITALCFILFVGGLQDGWPWYALVPLAAIGVLSFFGGDVDD